MTSPDPSEERGPRRLRAVESAKAATTPRRPERLPRNLPLALSTFIGREREVAEVKRLVGDERLLTLTGPGGAGKTRLALAVAHEVVEGFDEGAWWVGLAPLSDPDLVPQAVASTIGVRETPGRTLGEALVEDLKTKELLLILDNCEHLIDACAVLADTLLHACPNLKIFATSREALGVAGERAWAVPSLALPDPERLPPIEKLGRYEAIRLFCERAKATSSFELTEENASAVAKLCRRLDGIPLAIELAAARTTVLSAAQILKRLEDSLKLLAGAGRTAPTRQRTLRGTLDWSYELLGEQERKLFGRLCVFAGGWTLEGAEAVGAGEDIEEGEVLDLLSRLVDKSMVVVESGAEGALRYRMLEPVRQYAQECLEESGEAGQVRERHARYYLALAERAEQEWMGAQQKTRLEQLETEHDNLRAALGWSLEGGEAELGLRLSGALGEFWHIRGHLSEGRRWLERDLLRGSNSPISVRAKALNEAGWLAVFQGDRRATVLLEEGLSLYRDLGDKEGVATTLANLGMAIVHHQGDRRHLGVVREEAEALRRKPLDQKTLAHLLHFLAFDALGGGDYGRSATLAEEVLGLNRELVDTRDIVRCLIILGVIALVRDDHEQAMETFKEGLHLSQKLGDKLFNAYCLLGLAGAEAGGGRLTRAARLWGAVEALQEGTGIAAVSASALVRTVYDYEGRLAAARAQLDEAAWEAAWAEGRAMTPEEAMEYALKTEEPVPSSKGEKGELSKRELEVLRLVAEGLTNPQVADRLYVSPRTVGFHLRSIYRKLGVPSRAAAAKAAFEQGLI